MIAFLWIACTGKAEVAEPGMPSMVVEPAEVSFVDLEPGDVRIAEVHIRNVGDGPLILDPVEVDGSGWAVAGTPPSRVPPGASRTFEVAFTASAAGSFPGSATVRSNDASQSEVVVSLDATVLGPELVVEPADVSWGTGDLGGVFSTAVSLTNVGAWPLTLEGAELLGDPELDLGDLGEGPLVLAPGEATEVTVRWAPSEVGCVDASLVVRSDDPDASFVVVPVTGCAELPEGAHTVTITLTADDAWSGYLDGAELVGSAQTDWAQTDTFERTLGPGAHVLAIHGYDWAGVIAGVLGTVAVDGVTTWWTGDGNWRMSPTEEPGWEAPDFDASTWGSAVSCADDSPWGGQPSNLRSAGADWIWWTEDCTALGQAWFRLEFVLP